MVPRLRKSGSARDCDVLPYNRRHRASGTQASARVSWRPTVRSRGSDASYCRHARRAGQASTRAGPVVRRSTVHSRHAMADSEPPSQNAAAAAGPAASASRSRTSSSATRHPSISTGGWPQSTSPGSLAHARMLAAVGVLAARRPRGDRARHGDDPRRDRARRVRLVARPRGRPPQHREAPDGAGRRRRQAAAHRRARATTRSRPTSGCGCAARSTRWRTSSPALRRALLDLAEAPRRHDHARLHAPAGRAARDLRPPPARLRGDARARHGALRRLPPAREPAAAGQRGARRHELPDRPRARGARAGLRRPLHQLARRGLRPRLRDRVRGRRGARDAAPVAASPRS